jgi:predicted AAA+ superfamily ATPase
MVDYISRYIEHPVIEDLKRKMVFIGGPRQAGKTTLSRHLCERMGAEPSKRYLTWDAAEDRENIMLERFPAGTGPLVLDEIHKYSRWRQVAKGLFDKRKSERHKYTGVPTTIKTCPIRALSITDLQLASFTEIIIQKQNVFK